MGVIEIEITPISVTSGKDVIFEVVMNNHTVDLNYDYAKIATLTDDQGKSYQPTQWTGNSNGHHIKGKLIFPILPVQSKQLTITLNSIDNQSTDFSWQL